MLIRNSGSTIAASCNLKLYDSTNELILLTTIQIASLDVLQTRWEYIPLPHLNGEIEFRAIVNENGESFSEINIFNNTITSDSYMINMFEVGASGSVVSALSLDNNLLCEFPSDFLNEPAIFSSLPFAEYQALDVVNKVNM